MKMKEFGPKGGAHVPIFLLGSADGIERKGMDFYC